MPFSKKWHGKTSKPVGKEKNSSSCLPENGKVFKILNIIDEYTRECLAALVNRKIKTDEGIDQ